MSSTSTISNLQDIGKQTSPQYSSGSPTCYPHESVTQETTDAQPFPAAVHHPCADTFSTSEEEKEEKTMEKNDGVLTEEEVSSCLSNLGHSATGLEHVYQFLSAPGRNLNNVSILCNYVHLQKLELPYNKIKDVSCVSHMPYLIILDASHNQLTDFFGFQPPKNLKEVNFSHNQMSVMTHLSAYSSLSKLNLDYNCFSEIGGLLHCASLTHLSLAHNKISCIRGLDNLPIKDLCLRGNQIEKIENVETLRTLQVLDLSLNRISSLSGLQNLHLLGSINLESNLISEIKEATHIHDLCLLRELNLQRNLVQEQLDYRLAVIFLLQHLTGLDQEKVTVEEKVSAVNKYDPPLEVVAAREHMSHMVYQLMQPQVIYDSTLPSLDSPYPMLVLTGPQACGKRELAHKLCREFNDFFGYGTCHTTRGPYFGEEDGSDYHFVTEEDFQNMIHMGKFLQTMQYAGHWYGLSREAIEDVAREGLACCVHMELEGVFSLKNSHFEPRYVLMIPTDKEQYGRRLRTRALYTQTQIDTAVARVDTYVLINRERPGFFDNVIPCDEPVEAYRTLRQVVKDYLGVEEQGGEDQSTTDTPTELKRDSLVDEAPPAPSTRPETVFMSCSAPDMDPSDHNCRKYYNKVQAQLTPQKTSAEMASIHRRQQLVREALMGKSPKAYTQLFKRCVLTAPSSLASQMQRDPTLSSPMMPRASHDRQHNHSENSSSDDSRASSGLSIPSSAGAFSETAGSAGCSELGLDTTAEPLDVSSLGHNLDMLKDQVESGHTPDAPRPGSELLSPGATATMARPGSNAKPILPPILSGRKTPGPSPKPQTLRHEREGEGDE
ncbi:leucine-rich repeat and guanylate kinase domain-containing protein-like isoform X2 [Oncorhynchus mykiss]|uniref:Leucine-rich repeat and guanylate kinase domain-containing protein n=1 Tax=Oncorhynchus mykiss TaxID=8022 RepID=A0A8K9V3A5_ONCMY|nr:leucine-rich repeat and guanylate kinase domain-containing protein-like isoform X2 [Oncorhynchus mykiss]